MARSTTTWGRGRSGNPSGRPKSDLTERMNAKAREAGADMVDALIEVARDRNHPQRVAAAVAVLNRGFGTPRQSIEADVTTRTIADVLASLPVRMSDNDERDEGGEDHAAALN